MFLGSGGDGKTKFHLDSGSGHLILASALDYDVATGGTNQYEVTIRAVDGGVTAKSVESLFVVSLVAENDNPPIFPDALIQIVVAEDVSIDSVVSSVSATDADEDTLTYTVTGEGVGVFSYINSEVIITTKLDYETRKCYTFMLR